MKLAAHGLCLILLAIPFAAQASEDLVAKREACRIEARSRIVTKRKIEVEDYRRIVERRVAYVSQCVNRTFVAHSNVPLPPQRVLDDATEDDRQTVVPSTRKQPRRLAGRLEERKLKAASVRGSKKAFKGKRVRLSSRRSK